MRLSFLIISMLMRLSFLIISMLMQLSFLIISMLTRLSFLIISMLTRLSFLIISMLTRLARAYNQTTKQLNNKTTRQQNNKTTNLHTPREISGVARYDVLICFDELACHAVIDTDGRTASGRTIGQHDGAIVLITQS